MPPGRGNEVSTIDDCLDEINHLTDAEAERIEGLLQSNSGNLQNLLLDHRIRRFVSERFPDEHQNDAVCKAIIGDGCESM